VNSFWALGTFFREWGEGYFLPRLAASSGILRHRSFSSDGRITHEKALPGSVYKQLDMRPHLKLMLWERAAGSKKNADK